METAPDHTSVTVWEYQVSCAWVEEEVVSSGGTQHWAKKAWVGSPAARPAPESIAGPVRSSVRKRPSAWTSRLSHRVTPLPCRL